MQILWDLKNCILNSQVFKKILISYRLLPLWWFYTLYAQFFVKNIRISMVMVRKIIFKQFHSWRYSQSDVLSCLRCLSCLTKLIWTINLSIQVSRFLTDLETIRVSLKRRTWHETPQTYYHPKMIQKSIYHAWCLSRVNNKPWALISIIGLYKVWHMYRFSADLDSVLPWK